MNKHSISAFLVGLVFSAGLLVSGLANPAKVLAFLDLAGAWDPSLALVMGGAIALGLVAFTIARKRQVSLFGEPMRLPAKQGLDKRLVVGSLFFGVGWGLVGFCPGPALVAVGAGEIKALVFAIAMFAGMAAFDVIEGMRHKQPA